MYSAAVVIELWSIKSIDTTSTAQELHLVSDTSLPAEARPSSSLRQPKMHTKAAPSLWERSFLAISYPMPLFDPVTRAILRFGNFCCCEDRARTAWWFWFGTTIETMVATVTQAMVAMKLILPTIDRRWRLFCAGMVAIAIVAVAVAVVANVAVVAVAVAAQCF